MQQLIEELLTAVKACTSCNWSDIAFLHRLEESTAAQYSLVMLQKVPGCQQYGFTLEQDTFVLKPGEDISVSIHETIHQWNLPPGKAVLINEDTQAYQLLETAYLFKGNQTVSWESAKVSLLRALSQHNEEQIACLLHQLVVLPLTSCAYNLYDFCTLWDIKDNTVSYDKSQDEPQVPLWFVLLEHERELFERLRPYLHFDRSNERLLNPPMKKWCIQQGFHQDELLGRAIGDQAILGNLNLIDDEFFAHWVNKPLEIAPHGWKAIFKNDFSKLGHKGMCAPLWNQFFEASLSQPVNEQNGYKNRGTIRSFMRLLSSELPSIFEQGFNDQVKVAVLKELVNKEFTKAENVESLTKLFAHILLHHQVQDKSSVYQLLKKNPDFIALGMATGYFDINTVKANISDNYLKTVALKHDLEHGLPAKPLVKRPRI